MEKNDTWEQDIRSILSQKYIEEEWRIEELLAMFRSETKTQERTTRAEVIKEAVEKLDNIRNPFKGKNLSDGFTTSIKQARTAIQSLGEK